MWTAEWSLCILSCPSKLPSFSKLSSQGKQLNGFPTTVYYFMFFHARLNTTMRATDCFLINVYYFMLFNALNILITATWATEWFFHHCVFFHVFPPVMFYQGISLPTTQSFILLLKVFGLLIFPNSSGNMFHNFADV